MALESYGRTGYNVVNNRSGAEMSAKIINLNRADKSWCPKIPDLAVIYFLMRLRFNIYFGDFDTKIWILYRSSE